MLRSEAEELTAISQELAATTEHMASVSNVITKDLQELADESTLLKNEIRTIEHVLSKIKDTAIKSRILGLNASIEAARSGEHGRGFMVVANEIKKMADNSKEAVEGFEPQLKEMMKNMEKAIETIQQISAHSEEQSVIVEEFHQSFDHIVHTASELSKNANL
ncbi:methyl-accepting chemotaxis protein [Bacillus sp. JJ634]